MIRNILLNMSVLFILSVVSGVSAQLTFKATMAGSSQDSPYGYLRIVVTNPGAAEVEYDILVANNNGGSHTLDGLKIGPARKSVLNVPLLNAFYYYNYQITLSEKGRLPVTQWESWVEKGILEIGNRKQWSSQSQVNTFSQTFSSVTSGFNNGNEIVMQLEPTPGNLPDNWLCYSTYRAVIIDEMDFENLDTEAKSAILTWVKNGGWLTVISNKTAATERLMLGTIRYQSTNPIKTNTVERTWRINRAASFKLFNQTGTVVSSFPFKIEKFSGRFGGLLLATLFFVLAGPVNFFIVRKRGNIRLLMLTLPAISIAFCIFIMIFFLLAKGFVKQGGSFSVTMVQPSTNSSLTFASNVLYCGLYPLGGFNFKSDTAFYPLNYNNQAQNYSTRISDEFKLSSGLFKPSVNFHYFTSTAKEQRGRLFLNPESMEVTNAFKQKISGLVLRYNGKVFKTEALEAGATAKLTAVKDLRKQAMLDTFKKDFMESNESRYLKEMEIFYNPKLLTGKRKNYINDGDRFILRLDKAPPDFETGVEVSDPAHCHIMVGEYEVKTNGK